MGGCRQAERGGRGQRYGIGIPVAKQEIIFDEFRQSNRVARRGYGGMGLGLAISRRLVEIPRGQIGLLSSGTDGAGSTFYFTLPILAPVEVEPRIPISRDQAVLLLTERAGEAARLRDHLAGRGFTVETLSIDGHPNWLAQIVMSPPGAVVLDYEPAENTAGNSCNISSSTRLPRDSGAVLHDFRGTGQRRGAGPGLSRRAGRR